MAKQKTLLLRKQKGRIKSLLLEARKGNEKAQQELLNLAKDNEIAGIITGAIEWMNTCEQISKSRSIKAQRMTDFKAGGFVKIISGGGGPGTGKKR